MRHKRWFCDELTNSSYEGKIQSTLGDFQPPVWSFTPWYLISSEQLKSNNTKCHTRGEGVAQEVNLGEHISCTPPPTTNKVLHSGFETQRRRHQKSKTGVSVAPQKGLVPSENIFKKGVTTYGHRHTVVLFVRSATSEESDDEDDDSNNDQ